MDRSGMPNATRGAEVVRGMTWRALRRGSASPLAIMRYWIKMSRERRPMKVRVPGGEEPLMPRVVTLSRLSGIVKCCMIYCLSLTIGSCKLDGMEKQRCSKCSDT